MSLDERAVLSLLDARLDDLAKRGGVNADLFADLADAVAELPDDRQRQLCEELLRPPAQLNANPKQKTASTVRGVQ